MKTKEKNDHIFNIVLISTLCIFIIFIFFYISTQHSSQQIHKGYEYKEVIFVRSSSSYYGCPGVMIFKVDAGESIGMYSVSVEQNNFSLHLEKGIRCDYFFVEEKELK